MLTATKRLSVYLYIFTNNSFCLFSLLSCLLCSFFFVPFFLRKEDKDKKKAHTHTQLRLVNDTFCTEEYNRFADPESLLTTLTVSCFFLFHRFDE